MIRNLKTLGLAIVAVLAMSAVVASAASATQFTASSYKDGTTATAESAKGNDVFQTEAGAVECKAHFHVGPLTEASNRVTVDPTYSECKAFGFLHATVHMNGCDYTFFVNNVVDITCETPGEGPIVITAGTCEVQIHHQDTLGTVDLTNNANNTDINAQATVKNIAYTVTKDGFGCPFGGTGTKGGATYTQNNPVTVQGNGGRTISLS